MCWKTTLFPLQSSFDWTIAAHHHYKSLKKYSSLITNFCFFNLHWVCVFICPSRSLGLPFAMGLRWFPDAFDARLMSNFFCCVSFSSFSNRRRTFSFLTPHAILSLFKESFSFSNSQELAKIYKFVTLWNVCNAIKCVDIVLGVLNTFDMPRRRAYRYMSSSVTPKAFECLSLC